MKQQTFGPTSEELSCVIQGCMGLARDWDGDPNGEAARRVFRALDTALECGIDFFDHADIYGAGRCEELFGHWLAANPQVRERIFVQTKCGIRPDIRGYDFSAAHIRQSVDKSLERLQVEHLDCLLLHRPDVLMRPDEVAGAFDSLHAAGKVRHFGVSNHHAGLVELLRAHLNQPIVANQVQLNLFHTGMLDAGPDWNVQGSEVLPDATIPYCMQHKITVQAWSPMAGGLLAGAPCAADDRRAERVAAVWPVVQELAKQKDASTEAIVLAWLLHHPARIQPIIGTVNPKRIEASCRAVDVVLSKEEWYRLYVAGRGGRSVP